MFEILGIQPTLDPAAVKRAYFAAAQRCPPHADPDAFRAIRAAYEALSQPGALAAAFMASALEVPQDDELEQEIARAASRLKGARAHAAEIAAFVARASAMTLDEATRAFG